MPSCTIRENRLWKKLQSPDYNYVFEKKTGLFLRWGATAKEDPDWSPFGPEIADIEVSTVCHQGCAFCYKSNRQAGHNMSLETFRRVLAALPKTVTQIAFGIGDIDANPDLWDIFRHTRECGVVPNVTINGARMRAADHQNLAELCGAVAVSRYDNTNICYNAVEQLCRHGLQQVNIHQLLCEETYESCLELLDEVKTDPRLARLRAVVFLALKPEGRGVSRTPLRDAVRYKTLVQTALDKGVGIGFDSCSAPLFLKAVEGAENYDWYETLAEPCESTLFSVYIDVHGKMYPCSFLASGFEGINVVAANDFVQDVWMREQTVKWREELLATSCGGLVEGCRQCPAFDIYPEAEK